MLAIKDAVLSLYVELVMAPSPFDGTLPDAAMALLHHVSGAIARLELTIAVTEKQLANGIEELNAAISKHNSICGIKQFMPVSLMQWPAATATSPGSAPRTALGGSPSR